MSANQKGRLCGLCGNFNDDPDDDFQLGKNTEAYDTCPGLAISKERVGKQVRSN